MSPSRLFHSILLIGLAVCCGCGDGEGLVPVAGIVTLDGEPLPGVQVTFDRPDLGPTENVGYLGSTDDEGRYALKPIGKEGTGVPPGQYRVMLTTAVAYPYGATSSSGGEPVVVEENPTPAPERVPPAYRDGSLTFEVPSGGTDEANFELESE